MKIKHDWKKIFDEIFTYLRIPMTLYSQYTRKSATNKKRQTENNRLSRVNKILKDCVQMDYY